ncbi:MAG TPA: hypothetical protein VGE13_01555 [Candidatus Saccharimonadales bacterium]
MSTHPSEATQAGRTEFWEGIIDKELEGYHQIAEGIRAWKPLDLMRRKAQLKRLEDFIMRATVIIRESREADEQLTIRKAAVYQEDSNIQEDGWIDLPSNPDQAGSALLSNPEIA